MSSCNSGPDRRPQDAGGIEPRGSCTAIRLPRNSRSSKPCSCRRPVDRDQTAALLASLLSLPASDRYGLPELSPQSRKEKTLAALLGQLEALAKRQPVLVIFEDVHWMDPTSLELLTVTVERVRQLRVLLVITARPEFVQPWPDYAHVTTVALARLARAGGSAIIQRITGGKTLPEDVMNQILTRTDGVPLFVEELTKTVLESGFLRERNGHYGLEHRFP